MAASAKNLYKRNGPSCLRSAWKVLGRMTSSNVQLHVEGSVRSDLTIDARLGFPIAFPLAARIHSPVFSLPNFRLPSQSDTPAGCFCARGESSWIAVSFSPRSLAREIPSTLASHRIFDDQRDKSFRRHSFRNCEAAPYQRPPRLLLEITSLASLVPRARMSALGSHR